MAASDAEQWRDRRSLTLAAFAVLVTRLPWIASGYGSDPDGYRVVAAARAIARTGEYQPSRLPGFPVYEALTALTVQAPAWASNAVTSLCSVAAFVLFALILRHLRVRAALFIALGFAMTPVIYINSTCTMDYLPALALMLGATYLLLRARGVPAAICLGLATGCRVSSGLLGIALCAWLWLERPHRVAVRQGLLLGALSLLVAGLCYLPVYRALGAGFLDFYDNHWYPPFEVVYERGLLGVWGPLGLLALALTMLAMTAWTLTPPALARRSRRALVPDDPSQRHALALAALAVLLQLLLFARLPDESGYLIPAVAFVLLALSLLLPTAAAVTLAAVLMLSSFVSVDRGGVGLDGPVVADHAVRESQQRATSEIIEAVAQLPGQAIVVSGWILPRLMLALNGDREGPHRFVYLVENEGDYRHYVEQGHALYFVPGVDLYESQAHELALAEHGAQPLAVSRELQRPASTGE